MSLLALAPAVFVLIWSNRLDRREILRPYADPLTFLAARFAIAAAVIAPIALVMKAPWPRDGRAMAHAAISGVLLHAIYLGGGVVGDWPGASGWGFRPDRGGSAAGFGGLGPVCR